MKMYCLDCNGGTVEFHTDKVENIINSSLQAVCNKCGAKWSFRELLQDRDENCDSCGYPGNQHPNPWCEVFKPKLLENKK